MFSVAFWSFNPIFQKVPLIGGRNILFKLMVIFLSRYLHIEKVSWGFKIYHVIFGDKILRVLVLHIWNHLPEILKAEYLSGYLKGHYCMIGLNVSAGANLAVA